MPFDFELDPALRLSRLCFGSIPRHVNMKTNPMSVEEKGRCRDFLPIAKLLAMVG
jgi:hypothetical protein